MENSKPIVEGGGIPKPEKMKIIKVMRSKSFMNYRKDLEKQGMKVVSKLLPGYIPSDEIFGIFKNHLAIGPTE